MIDEEPLDVADLMVEYGPVSIGGIDYICPVRSVAIVVTRGMELGGHGASGDVGLHDSPHFSERGSASLSQTILNDVVIENYHLLRSEARILTGADTEDSGPTAPDRP